MLPKSWKRRRASSLNELGLELSDAGREADAEGAYLSAIRADPEWSVPWYNLGLMYKYQGRWADSARCNLRAAELAPDDEAAWWNLGIAATALRDWALARRAWRGCGMQVPDGDGPLELDYGSTPVRLDPQGRGEVVWCRRIDPARAVIENVPLPESGHRAGDVLLHDGAANGWRTSGGQEFPVFDMLALLERSGRATYEAWIVAPGEEDVDVLKTLADAADVPREDWTGSIRTLCRACSEGRPHEHHDQELEDGGWQPRRRLGLGLRTEEEGRALLERWAAQADGRGIESLRNAESA